MKNKKKQAKKLRRIIIKIKKAMQKYDKQRAKFLKDIPPEYWNKHF